ncbi:MAG TPA: hypothetical protein VKT30_09980 [Caulobacteraceae bacterium]|nr:hypothetical protein [Caulobacteraceae bacterium]
MSTPEAQRRAVANHRRRMRDAGLDRFEVRGLLSDKPLLRAIAKRLARGDVAAGKLRAIFEAAVGSRREPH